MNRKKIGFNLLLTFLAIGLNTPVQADNSAQWDFNGLNGTVNPMQSAGGAGAYAGNQIMTPGYPYAGVSNPMSPQGTYQAQYGSDFNQYGSISNQYPASAQVGLPITSSMLSPVSMPALSYMQKQSSTGYLPKNLPGVYNNLPPTVLDSFVKDAGGAAYDIYGDEGTSSYPRLNGLTEANTINAGIRGINNLTLTTGHGSRMPTASGNGVTMSGPRAIKVREKKE